MEMGIRGKVALVTGASRGLGAGICQSLAEEGVTIIGCARSGPALESVIENLPNGPHHYICEDLSKEGATKNLIIKVNEITNCPDIIVNNVGGNLGFTDPLGPLEEWHLVMHLNVDVAIEINETFLPLMQQKKWGRICHISSISALENQGPPAYCAAKLALNAYVRSVSRYVAKDNVILTSVLPGAVFTEGGYWDLVATSRPDHLEKYLSDRMAIGRLGQVKEISNAVTFMCSQHASFCVGSCLLVDGGQGRVFHEGN